MRYFKPLRIAMYQRLAAVFRQIAPDVTVYFCMEDEEVWVKTFGFFPGKPKALAHMLDRAAADRCGLDNSLL
jgi:spore photoproduct lyase